MYTRIIITMGCFLLISICFSQNDLLEKLTEENTSISGTPAFKGLQIVNLQSTKMVNQSDLYFVVSHRFGSIKNGVKTFFGLDNATTKIGFIYGINKWLSLGAYRHTLNKVYESTLKYRIIAQNQKNPVSLVGYHALQINTQLEKSNFPKLAFHNRLSYVTQILISRKVSNSLSVEFVGAYIHKNIYNPVIENQKQFAWGGGGRFKLSNRLSFNAEYMYSNKPAFYNNPLSLGIDLDTGGHIFQLLFTNAQAMNESAYITNASGNWNKGDIYFGFNLYRVF